MTKIDLKELFKGSLCTFEISKLAKAAGVTCKNTFPSYDSQGELNDGAWMEMIGVDNFYPAINIPFAILMLEDTALNHPSQLDLTLEEKIYTLRANEKSYTSENIVDVLVLCWLDNKEIDPNKN